MGASPLLWECERPVTLRGRGKHAAPQTNDIKKADVTKRQWACGHVGLLITSPPRESEVALYLVVLGHGLHCSYPRPSPNRINQIQEDDMKMDNCQK